MNKNPAPACGPTRLSDEVAACGNGQEQRPPIQEMEALEKFAGGIAHDFNNIFMVIAASLELLEDQLEQPERTQRLMSAARRGLNQGVRLTDGLLAFSQTDHRPRRVVIGTLVSGSRRALSEVVGPSVRLEIDASSENGFCKVDEERLRAALLDLARNAKDAMPEGGTLTLRTSRLHVEPECARTLGVDEGDYIAIAMTDTGVGMMPEILQRASEPFFTTKRKARGAGLGLPKAHLFARRSRGFLTLQSTPNEGSTATVHLPLVI